MSESFDQNEFVQLLETNRGIIIKICNAYCPDRSYREDLTQEIIYQLWKSAGRFQREYKFSTWMYRIALNVAISFYRKQKTQQAVVTYTDASIDATDHSQENSGEKEFHLLEQLIAALAPLDKAMMILYLDAKSYAEIADILGISETNVATKMSRVKAKLKQQFIQHTNN